MVGGIKSLCADPARSKLGFLSLQFLIMYRPPAKEACIAVLRELSDGDQADLKVEAEKLLNKYEVPSS
ncbi:CIC11C00000001847 [Sungouiella intermedia]|nr:CIC11C00000001847 [[Candida] intermedia]